MINSSPPQPIRFTWKLLKWLRMRNLGKTIKRTCNKIGKRENSFICYTFILIWLYLKFLLTHMLKSSGLYFNIWNSTDSDILSQIRPTLHFKRNGFRSLHWISTEEELCHEGTTRLGDHASPGGGILAEMEQGHVWWEGSVLWTQHILYL